jgi:hypothetical protein
MNIDELKITVKPKYYFGYLQGVTVHINQQKKITFMHITKIIKQLERL